MSSLYDKGYSSFLHQDFAQLLSPSSSIQDQFVYQIIKGVARLAEVLRSGSNTGF